MFGKPLLYIIVVFVYVNIFRCISQQEWITCTICNPILLGAKHWRCGGTNCICSRSSYYYSSSVDWASMPGLPKVEGSSV